MAQYCVYAVVHDGRWWHSGSKLGGYEVDQVVALGATVTLAYLAELGRWAPEEAGVWGYRCDAGAVVDLDRRVLLVYTDQLEPGERLAFLDGLTRAWPGWESHWAYDGQSELADYVGVDPARVVAGDGERTVETADEIPVAESQRDGPFRASVTVAVPDGMAIVYELPAWPEPWWYGPRLLDLLRPEHRREAFDALPRRGIHIDPTRLTAGLWETVTWDRLAVAWPRIWPGWTLLSWQDRYEEQIVRAGGALVLPELDLARERERYGQRLDRAWVPTLAESRDHPAWQFLYEDPSPLAARHHYPTFKTGLTTARYADLRATVTGLPVWHRLIDAE